jgi:hypothetical protein
VLAWVLQSSHHILQRHLELISSSLEYADRARRILRSLVALRQLWGIGDAIANTNLRIRPSIKSVTQAAESRKRLYRKACAAFQILTKIEAGDADATIRLLSGSLIGPLEEWQKFELLVGLKLSESLATAIGEELVLLPIQLGSDRPIAAFGPCDLYWQSCSPFQISPEPEPSELVIREILQSYGISAGGDRPDLVICDRVRGIVIAVAEAKFSTAVESWKDAFRAAASQLVRYSRMYTDGVPQEILLARSVLAVSNLPDLCCHPQDTSPVAFGLPNLIGGTLNPWVERVIASSGLAPAPSIAQRH